MRDVVFEWYVPYFPDKKKQLMKAVIISAAIVFLIDAIFFAAGMLLLSITLSVIGFFVFRSWNFEYEYVYVNGDFTVSKIIRKSKRKDVYHVYWADIEAFKEGRTEAAGRTTADFTSGRPDVPVCTIKAKGQAVYIESSEEFCAWISHSQYNSVSGSFTKKDDCKSGQDKQENR